MRILNIAEKPSVAREVSNILSQGQLRAVRFFQRLYFVEKRGVPV